jgi:hypothetical protein
MSLSLSQLRMRVRVRSIRRCRHGGGIPLTPTSAEATPAPTAPAYHLVGIPAIVMPRLLLLLPLLRLLPRLSLVSFPPSVASVFGATALLAVVHPAVVGPRRG